MATPRNFPCAQCGAALQYKPGEAFLERPYCKFKNEIAPAAGDGHVHELDFWAFVQNRGDADALEERQTLACKACGASSHAGGAVAATACPFCGSSLVGAGQARLIKPRALLPFAVDERRVRGLFDAWLKGLWFAPNELRRIASVEGRLNGIYVPYWTYDAETTTAYRGERGEYYTTTERYTENGETRTREVQHTRWYPAQGSVARAFDDVLVMASASLPAAYAEKLEPWDLAALLPYEDAFLAGFKAECYQMPLEQGFERAKERMAPRIRADICAAIGGDEQRVVHASTAYAAVSFKHVLLPVWLAAYRYRARSFRFLVNGRTGEVQGERPFSVVKIFFAAVFAVIVIGLALAAYQATQVQR